MSVYGPVPCSRIVFKESIGQKYRYSVHKGSYKEVGVRTFKVGGEGGGGFSSARGWQRYQQMDV